MRDKKYIIGCDPSSDDHSEWATYILVDGKPIASPFKPKRFWISVIAKEKCLFSRRNEISGKIIFGYSVRLRLFGKDII
jgi:hypothetical protein